ncbi:MAG: hypothetical protein ACQEUG_13250 [Pseudomonadota bacterium]
MALSPWHVAPWLKVDEVAKLLSGLDMSLTSMESVCDHEIKEFEEWRRIIVEAAKDGNLTPDMVEVYKEDPLDKLRYSDPIPPEMNWHPCFDESWRKYLTNCIKFSLKREEVYRWLKSAGIADDDIPEALRVMPRKRQAGEADGLHPSRIKTYQSVIAALVALQYGNKEIAKPFQLAEEVLDDCQLNGIRPPAGRSTLGELFKQLPPVQDADSD